MDKSNNVEFETIRKNTSILSPISDVEIKMWRRGDQIMIDWIFLLYQLTTLYIPGPVENAERGCSVGFLINGTWKGSGQTPPVSLESWRSF